jgi:hypothetical protein
MFLSFSSFHSCFYLSHFLFPSPSLYSFIPFCLLCLCTLLSSFTFYFISPFFSTFPPLYISSFVIHALSFSPTTSISCEIQIPSIGDASFARPAIVPDDGVSAYEKVSTRLNCLL